MSYKKTGEDVKAFLPHGALLVRDNKPEVAITSLEVENTPQGATLIGYAHPHKICLVELNNVLPQKGGWLCFSGGIRIVLRPLTEAQGKANEELLEDMT